MKAGESGSELMMKACESKRELKKAGPLPHVDEVG
jgi:hypothetical protein